MQQPGQGQGRGYRYYPYTPVAMPMTFYGQYPAVPTFGQYGIMPPPMNPTSTGAPMMTNNNTEDMETTASSRYPAEYTGCSQPLERSHVEQSEPEWSHGRQWSSDLEQQHKWSSRQNQPPQECLPRRPQLERLSQSRSYNSSSEYVKREIDVGVDDSSFPGHDAYYDENYPDNYNDELDDYNRDLSPLPHDPEGYSNNIGSDNDVYPRAVSPNYNNAPLSDEVYDRYYSRQSTKYSRNDNSQKKSKARNRQPASFKGPTEVENKKVRPIEKMKLHQCPIPDCMIENKTRKAFSRHVIEKHLPPPMDITKIALNNGKRKYCLTTLAKYILGKPEKLKMLLPLVKGKVRSEHSHVTDIEKGNIRSFCKFHKWLEPRSYNPSNPSSVAMCLHWSVALELLLLLSHEQRKQFRKMYPDKPAPVNAKPKLLDMIPRLDATAKLREKLESGTIHIPVVPKPGSSSALSEEDNMLDSHFHFDQTAWCMKLDIAKTKLEDLLKVNQDPPPIVKVKVTGGVMVYSDPAYYPHKLQPRKGFKVAFGVHPHNIEKFTKDKEKQMWELVDKSPDGPVGAIGLDWTEPSDTWPAQERAFRRVLKRCCVARPLILHIRGPVDDDSVYDKALEITKQFCGTQQPIHIHRFSGTISAVAAWSAYFQFVYFGFAGSVAIFSPAQHEALRHVPLNRIMVESDSPFLSPHPAIEVNTPAYLGDVANIVAQARGVDLKDLIRASNKNTKLFYDL